MTCDRSVVFLGDPVSSTNKTDQPRYSWNMMESGVKHYNPNTHIMLYEA
jgi:hypothetical protein